MHWQSGRLDELAVPGLYALLAAREAVFVVEQRCAYQELDGLDLEAWHLVAWAGTAVAGCLRVLAPGARYPEPSIGRLLVMPDWRGQGLAAELLARALAWITCTYPGEDVRISAQAHLCDYYRQFGFIAMGEPYDEDGIPHVEMLRPATVPVN